MNEQTAPPHGEHEPASFASWEEPRQLHGRQRVRLDVTRTAVAGGWLYEYAVQGTGTISEVEFVADPHAIHVRTATRPAYVADVPPRDGMRPPPPLMPPRGLRSSRVLTTPHVKPGTIGRLTVPRVGSEKRDPRGPTDSWWRWCARKKCERAVRAESEHTHCAHCRAGGLT